jgi:IS30 family transposase
VSPATITREIIRNRRDDGVSHSVWRTNNRCAHRKSCDIHHLCTGCERKCSQCKADKCNRICKDYVEEACKRILGVPHVCNGCKSSGNCTLHRYRYSSSVAQRATDERARESRQGIDVTKEAMQGAVAIIKPLLAKRQSPALIFAEHGHELPFSLRSCYRHIHNGDIDIVALELPKAVKYRPRHHTDARAETMPSAILSGRTYADFMALDEVFRAKVVQCDCLEGPAGTFDAILTLHFVALHFQIGIKLKVKEAAHVIEALDFLEDISSGRFSELFGVLLCDRGMEFRDVVGMESRTGKRRCAVYFTDAQRPNQKGACEKNHVEVRKVIPKGTPLAQIDAYVLAEVFSHVNSAAREELFWLTPMALALSALPHTLLEGLGYRLVAPDDVVLRPSLLEDAIACDRKAR